jgi:tetratricopeptide (TPR) repeat protein
MDQKAVDRDGPAAGTNTGKARSARLIPSAGESCGRVVRPSRAAVAGPAGKERRVGAVLPGMTEPMSIDLHSEYLRADLLLAVGSPTEAARTLAAVVEAEPANEAALELLARSYFASAQLGRAEAALVRLVELAPANGWARRALARTLERQSRRDEAVAHHRVADALGAA